MPSIRFALPLAVAASLALAATAAAAPDRTGTLNAGTTAFKWTGPVGFGVVTFSDTETLPCETPLAHDCDYTLLHVTTPGKLTVKTSTSSPAMIDTSISVYASDASGTIGRPKASADSSSPNVNEQVAFTIEDADSYWLVEIHYLDSVGGDYNGEAILAPGEGVELTNVAPTVKISSPKKSVSRSKFKSISGTAADESALTKVEVAITSGKGSKCKSMSSSGSFAKASCSAPKFLKAKGTKKWSYKLKKKLKKGTYTVYAKATDDAGGSTTQRSVFKVK